MEKIELTQTLPNVFLGRDAVVSEIWHQHVVLERGKTYLIEAASGTGKTSLCSFVYGWRNDYQGVITFDSVDIRNLSVGRWVEIRRKSLSMLFQELRLFPELTAWENVMIKHRLTGYQDRSVILDWFSRLGIADKLEQKAGKMSLGQQQRVAFIRALCQPFDFIFLDEPVSHIDAANASVMAEILQEESSRQGAGIIVTSIGNRLNMNYDKSFNL